MAPALAEALFVPELFDSVGGVPVKPSALGLDSSTTPLALATEGVNGVSTAGDVNAAGAAGGGEGFDGEGVLVARSLGLERVDADLDLASTEALFALFALLALFPPPELLLSTVGWVLELAEVWVDVRVAVGVGLVVGAGAELVAPVALVALVALVMFVKLGAVEGLELCARLLDPECSSEWTFEWFALSLCSLCSLCSLLSLESLVSLCSLALCSPA